MRIMWFRRDLRTIDNTALVNATAVVNRDAGSDKQPVVAVFVATPEQWHQQHMAPMQADLIFRRLGALKAELSRLNIPLLYAETTDYQKSAGMVSELATQIGAHSIYANTEYELNEQRRDTLLSSLSEKQGIKVCFFHDRCLFAPGSVLNKEQRYFKVFTPFKRKWLERFTSVPLEVRQPEICEAPPENIIADAVNHSSFSLFQPDVPFSYPRKDSMDYLSETPPILGQLRQYCLTSLSSYADRRDYPAIDGTSRLSPYLAVGALSVRQSIAAMREVQNGDFNNGAEVWLSELIWREFYQHLSALEFRISRKQSFHPWGERLHWQNNIGWFDKWKRGETGFPIVDAAMRQLNQTGWMHNRLRMVVASFLIKDLHIDWRWGEDYFMSQLVDGDFASNNGGWQWSASTGCDGQPYFRIFNPVSQGEKFDPDGAFVRRWLPELKVVPDKFIHKPWLWKESDRLNYRPPLVDHRQQREIALAMYQKEKNASGQNTG